MKDKQWNRNIFGPTIWDYWDKLFENEDVLPFNTIDRWKIDVLERRGFVRVARGKVMMTKKGLKIYLEESERKFLAMLEYIGV